MYTAEVYMPFKVLAERIFKTVNMAPPAKLLDGTTPDRFEDVISIKSLMGLGGVIIIVRQGVRKVDIRLLPPKDVNGSPDFANHFTKQAGVFAGCLRLGTYQVNSKLLTYGSMKRIIDRVLLFKAADNEGTYDLFDSPITDAKGNIREVRHVTAELFAKLLCFVVSSQLQNKLLDRLDTLRREQFNYYYSTWCINQYYYVQDMDILSLKTINFGSGASRGFMIANGLNPDHVLKGFIPMDIDIKDKINLPVYKQYRDKAGKLRIKAMGSTKKSLSRIKLKKHSNGIVLMEFDENGVLRIRLFDAFVITWMAEEAKKYHCVGAVYSPHWHTRRYGASRWTGGDSVVKAVSIPHLPGHEDHWKDVFVGGDKAFKGGMFGIDHSCVQPQTLVKTTFMGHEVHGYYCKIQIEITNLVVAYGLRIHDGLLSQINENPNVLLDFTKKDSRLKEFAEILYAKYSGPRQAKTELSDEKVPTAKDIFDGCGFGLVAVAKTEASEGELTLPDELRQANSEAVTSGWDSTGDITLPDPILVDNPDFQASDQEILSSEGEIELPTEVSSDSEVDTSTEDDHDAYVKNEESTSAYDYMSERIKKDPSFEPCEWLEVALEAKLLKRLNTSVQFKAMMAVNAYRSYGPKFANDLVDAVVAQQLGTGYNELNEYLLGNIKPKEINLKDLKPIAKLLYMESKQSAALIDPIYLARNLEQNIPPQLLLGKSNRIASSILDELVNGRKGGFYGLLNKMPKRVVIRGYTFYVPGGRVMKQFIYPEPDNYGGRTGRYIFNGPALLFNKLLALLAKYNCDPDLIPDIHLKMFSVDYYAQMQKALYGRFGENQRIEGAANLTIVPYVSEDNVVVCCDPRFEKWSGQVVMTGKSPILHNMALHPTIFSSDIEKVFGQLDSVHKLALSSMLMKPYKILLAMRDDADGDLGTVFMLALPEWFRQLTLTATTEWDKDRPYFAKWIKTYSDAENDMEIVRKEYVDEDRTALHDAVMEAVLARRTIGQATNLANIFCTVLLEAYPWEDVTRVTDSFYMGLQVLIQGAKHSEERKTIEYFAGHSFGQIFGAVSHYYGDLDMTDKAISELVDEIAKHGPVGRLGNQLRTIRDKMGYKWPIIRGALRMKNGSVYEPITRLPVAMRWLSVYIRSWAYKMSLTTFAPNYEFYMTEGNSYTAHWNPILEKYEDVMYNLLFATGIKKPPEGDRILGIFYKLMQSKPKKIESKEEKKLELIEGLEVKTMRQIKKLKGKRKGKKKK